MVPIRVVDVVAGKWLAPIVEDSHQTPGFDFSQNLILRKVSQAEPGQCRRRINARLTSGSASTLDCSADASFQATYP